ncbi:MAG: DUF2309 family protein, partial [Nitrosopumilaceae archaeon]|nr:DUF2309 family protein [Nitrosopumilaceae archaeon]
TDDVTLYCNHETEEVRQLKINLEKARKINSTSRLRQLGLAHNKFHSAQRLSCDWAQVRPEWGLARNAAFIIAPRDLTSSLDLDGRCFLHSYDYKKDPEGVFLTTILGGLLAKDTRFFMTRSGRSFIISPSVALWFPSTSGLRPDLPTSDIIAPALRFALLNNSESSCPSGTLSFSSVGVEFSFAILILRFTKTSKCCSQDLIAVMVPLMY